MNEIDIVEVYRRLGKWRWRYRNGGNRKIMANGGEAYANLSDILRSVEQVLDQATIYPPFGVNWVTERQKVSRKGGWPDLFVVITR